jgi:hypothetical protein
MLGAPAERAGGLARRLIAVPRHAVQSDQCSLALEGFAQFSEALAIAPRALGSARRLTAKRRTPFPPCAHYELGTWF